MFGLIHHTRVVWLCLVTSSSPATVAGTIFGMYYDKINKIMNKRKSSDEICKAVTGIGHTKRELYSDDDDIIYEHRRVLSINGINVALTEPDALDRSIFIEPPDIDDIARRGKEELLAEFEK